MRRFDNPDYNLIERLDFSHSRASENALLETDSSDDSAYESESHANENTSHRKKRAKHKADRSDASEKGKGQKRVLDQEEDNFGGSVPIPTSLIDLLKVLPPSSSYTLPEFDAAKLVKLLEDAPIS